MVNPRDGIAERTSKRATIPLDGGLMAPATPNWRFRMHSPILTPVIALVLWSFVMWAWLYATRMPAMIRLKIKDDPRRPRSEFDEAIPPEVRWVADNYNHLMEQPTIFYATALSLALLGLGAGLNAWLAWGYVGLRVIHSLVQATVNVTMVRWVFFTIASILLLIMAIRAAMALL